MVQNVLDSVPLLKKVGQIRKSDFLDSGIHPNISWLLSKDIKIVNIATEHESRNISRSIECILTKTSRSAEKLRELR